MRAFFALLMIAASIYAAHAFGIGRESRGFGRLGAMNKGASGAASVGCASTGIFDLSNTCNDIYFIGVLK